MITVALQAMLVATMYVGLRSFQQLNVVHKDYKLIPPVSMAMALCDWWTINKVVHSDWHIAIAIGIGGASGALFSVWAHKHWFEKEVE